MFCFSSFSWKFSLFQVAFVLCVTPCRSSPSELRIVISWVVEELFGPFTGETGEEAQRGPNLAFLLSWVCPPQMSKGLNSRQTRNNAPVIKFETKIQQRHEFAARKQIALSFLSHFFFRPNKTSSYEICPICNIYFPFI